MKNFTVKIKTSILSMFLLIVIVIITTMIMMQYKLMEDMIMLSTQKSFKNISNKIVNQIERYDDSSDSFISLLSDLTITQAPVEIGKQHPLLPIVTNYINKSKYTYGVYIGYGNNNFYQVINLNISSNIKSLLKVPLNSRWLVVKHFNINGLATRIEESLDEDLNIIKSIEKKTQYKPTQRPWYKKAILNDSTVKTNPYIFSSLKKSGVTYAKKVNSNPSMVIGLDISLESLGEMLGSADLVQNSGAYIFKNDGMIIGQYDTFQKELVTNINQKYQNIFISKKKINHIQNQLVLKIDDKEFIVYGKKLSSKFKLEENIVIFSSLEAIMKPSKEKIYQIIKYIILFILFLVIPSILFITNLISRPIARIEKENTKIKNGQFDKVKTIDSFIIEINSLSQSLVNMSKVIEQNQKTLEQKVSKRTKDIENLLDNSNQGFLSFDNKMIIGEKSSEEAKRIFNQEIANKNIITLLYPNDQEKQHFMTQTLEGILKDDPIKQEILLSLLDKELIINTRNISIEYKIISKTSYMLILTDITANKELAQEIQKEQQTLKMVVEIVTTFEQFLEIKQDYEKFVSGINSFTQLEYLKSLRNSIHTFKGLFAQKEMLTMVHELHQLETYIDQTLKQKNIVPELKNITKITMLEWLEKDIDILRSILGDDFLSQTDKISIDKIRLERILVNLTDYLDKHPKFSEVYKEIEELTFLPVKVFIEPYKKLVEQLSFKMDKNINPLHLEYDNIYLNNTYKPFFNSLVHIFRNSIDHGIEFPEERLNNMKDEYGNISYTLRKKDDNIIITISDDGKGINLESLKSKALEKGLFTLRELQRMKEQDIIMMIFAEGFTTAKEVTNISGRGIGLSSVYTNLQKLGGKVFIKNNLNKGVKFTFTLPLKG